MASMHDLRRLHVLVAVAEHGSFSAAAVELGYAQSVVSHHVAALEHELGGSWIVGVVRCSSRRPVSDCVSMHGRS